MSTVPTALHARALAADRFETAAQAVLGALARELGCERVSLGLAGARAVAVRAIADQADIDARSPVVRALAAVMDEALDQRATVVFPGGGGAPRVTVAHRKLAEIGRAAAIATMPIVGADRLAGALVFERSAAFDAETLRLAEDAAAFIGPVLELKARVEAPIAARMRAAISGPAHRSPTADRGRAARRWAKRAVIACVLAGLAAASFTPITFRVIAPARVEGIVQRVIAAPVDGFVREVALRPGATVRAGQTLAALEDRDLALERDKWSAEIAQHDKLYREALSKDDPAQIVVARAKLEQARTQLALTLQQLERLKLRAPIDGVLISGDLTQSIGAPVKRGQELMVIAPGEGFRVVAEVDEQDIEHLRAGQRARVVFASASGAPVEVELARIAPMAVAKSGRNFFEVELRERVSGAAPGALRHGLQGVAKIDIDERAAAQAWTLRARKALERLWWRWTG